MDFENNSDNGTIKKRNEKYQRKLNEEFQKLSQHQPESLAVALPVGPVHTENEDSGKEKSSIINNKIDREIDSLMDQTFQSGTDN